jgi:hypothetical protein
MSRNSYADYIKHWGELKAAIAAAPELAFLEPQRGALELELQALIAANLRQASFKSQAQEATRDLEGCAKRGADLATRLRDALRAYYGRTGEQLVGFRLQPRRPRILAKDTPTPPGTENAKPSGMGPNPSRTADPETDASTQE